MPVRESWSQPFRWGRFQMVPEAGLEPARPCGQGILGSAGRGSYSETIDTHREEQQLSRRSREGCLAVVCR